MSKQKYEVDFQELRINAHAWCWQIDNDRLEGALADGGWQTALTKELIDLAEAQEGGSLLCANWANTSVDFGHLGFSVWLAIVGTPPLMRACRDVVEEMIPPKFRRRQFAPANEHFVSFIRIEDSKAWVPDDPGEWRVLSHDDKIQSYDAFDDLDDLEEAESDDPWVPDDLPEAEPGDPASTDTPIPRYRRKKSTNAAHNDVGIGYYQSKIERMFKLPKGSVRFVKPDGNVAHPRLLVRNLRSQWED